ncbi:MAG: phosphate ABC transporter permease subunit PstC [Oscillospiraceae bacterium]|nr:phosphate ABC transporter permease subunit PstC [Oscillospiraceae bacterium]
MAALKESAVKAMFATAACASILAVFFICLFIFWRGLPAMFEIGVWDFVSGDVWRPTRAIFGILPMIVGSLYVTAGAIVIGVPIGVLTAVFMARFCPAKLYLILKPIVELMAGIPSVVYGLVGVQFLVPLLHQIFPQEASGASVLAASIVLGIMILPTVINVSEAALRAVPNHYYEGALALGATHERAVFFTQLPAAKSGVLASVILGVGRAIGETMAVIWVAGNAPVIPGRILDSARTLTANVALEMGYAEGLHQSSLFATAVVLFVFILIINLCFTMLKRKS